MDRKACFEDSGKVSELAIDEEEECIDDGEKQSRKARARELLSEYGW